MQVYLVDRGRFVAGFSNHEIRWCRHMRDAVQFASTVEAIAVLLALEAQLGVECMVMVYHPETKFSEGVTV